MYGTPEEIASDGAPVYTSAATRAFLEMWGVRQRISTAYNPHANLRAESAVKTIKRLIMENVGEKSSLDTDKMAFALLAYRNTPDRDTGRYPAQVLFARQLQDAVPCEPGRLQLRPEWIMTCEQRERALAKRHEARGRQLEEHTRPLQSLSVGTTVQIQNQKGQHKNKWDVSGVVVEVLAHDAYLVKVDGSGRVSKRNGRFLRPIVAYSSLISKPVQGVGVPGGPRDLRNAGDRLPPPTPTKDDRQVVHGGQPEQTQKDMIKGPVSVAPGGQPQSNVKDTIKGPVEVAPGGQPQKSKMVQNADCFDSGTMGWEAADTPGGT